ncbi:MAG: HsdR family type I site-specific deoxyribonuclease [Thermoleophilaceae bacterium]|nr:HsdR family type I site-specific deoxyribonuclease [Thermoleophilaceae bacterium]
MSTVGQLEREVQPRVVKLFENRLNFVYLGDWQYPALNSNIEVPLLEGNLLNRGYDDDLIDKAVEKLKKAAAVGGGRHLYEANREVYELLRYGVKVKPGAGEHQETVWLIDWETPEANEFAIAEEVTVYGQHSKRPDLVLYVNGIAVAVIELKRSKVAVSEGIRQSIGNQKPEFIQPFFSTVQLLIAGNDVEGLHYAVIGTPEKYWLRWKLTDDIHAELRAEIEQQCEGIEEPLDEAFVQLCSKRRLLEVIHDFIVFDRGIKKICRPNQYFGVKAAQERARRREGGIIWHTQGAGKSLTMVWLAKWLREHQRDARVLLITDRTELDEQIEGVFEGVNEQIYRTKSGRDMLDTLNKSDRWLICSLIHKFRGSQDEKERDAAGDAFIRELQASLPAGFSAKGNIYVFVDEAHRTQSGKLHAAMKKLLPGAMFIGFTGTPLLKADKPTTIATFGTFIHTYKFDEAVDDGVVLDLRYEARNIGQRLSSPQKVDQWFDAQTKGMTDVARAELKKRWGTLQKVTSAEPRARHIVNDILLDMKTRPRLADGRGNAILVSGSIYQACKFYELFSATDLKGKVAIVTSYQPQAGDISKEDTGHGATEKLRQYQIYRQMLADHFGEPADVAMNKVELFEEQVKERFVNEPGQMRLLIVVDKLLTGFDAPSATYLYIDKKMRDHGLFQAICRVNRLDGEDKTYGYIVDYRDLFKSLSSAITDYTSGALDGYDPEDIDGLLNDRIKKAREDLDNALEKVELLCEPVEPPKGTVQYQRYFCASEPGNAEQLKANEAKRVELYKDVAALVRAYGAIANELPEAGYSDTEAAEIKMKVGHYADVRDEVKLGAGENLDLKEYEADMRFLLDTYIQADPSEVVADFEDAGLIQLIVKLGVGAIDKLPTRIKSDPAAVAETILGNTRRLIIDQRATNPKYYDRMSQLLDAIIEEQKKGALDYKQYLERLIEHAQKVAAGEADGHYPDWANSSAKRALIDFGLPDELARTIDRLVMETKPAEWIGTAIKEKKVRNAVRKALPDGYQRLDELMNLLKAQDEYQ